MIRRDIVSPIASWVDGCRSLRRTASAGFRPSDDPSDDSSQGCGQNVGMARVLLGVTGGIAAYKTAELARLLVKSGHEVTPLLTREAETFVGAKTFEALTRRPAAGPPDLYPHLVRAELLVIAPLSANTLAKLANGLADNVLTQTALAFEGPVLAAPAMNPRMWAHAATQENVERLRCRGVVLLGPDEGESAEGEWGVGRMVEPEEIFARAEALLARREQLAGKRVLVSAGGTREPLDAVRFLGNRSSGRMGVALAEEARLRGAEVTLVAANLAVPAPGKVDLVPAPTAAAVEREVLARADADVVVMAAAVADYRPAEPSAEKRAKDGDRWTVTLEPTSDVLRELGVRRRREQLLVGFAADHGERGLARAREKLETKRSDLIVFNDVSRDDIGFDAPANEVVLISAAGERRIQKAPKERIASEIVDEIAKLVGTRGESDGRSTS
jgi:phosphopantothenoylcysteine decarboxylase / phosphopantothenate---cysteine ligase